MYIMVLVKRKFTTVLILIPWNTPGRCDCFSITPIVPSGNSCFWLTMTYVKNNDIKLKDSTKFSQAGFD